MVTCMVDRWTQAKLDYEKEVQNFAADLLDAGRGPPAECMTVARQMVLSAREARFRAAEKLRSKIVVIEGGKRKAPKVD